MVRNVEQELTSLLSNELPSKKVINPQQLAVIRGPFILVQYVGENDKQNLGLSRILAEVEFNIQIFDTKEECLTLSKDIVNILKKYYPVGKVKYTSYFNHYTGKNGRIDINLTLFVDWVFV